MHLSEWIEFEAERIVHMGSLVPTEHRSDYVRVQIEAALRKAFAHGETASQRRILLALW
jgi:hypothetical protein